MNVLDDRDGVALLKVPGAALHPLAIFADLVAQIREELGVSREELSRQTGIPARAIEKFEERELGSLTLKQVVHLLQGLDCRLELRPVRNRCRSDEPFEALRRK
jgi:transcriptional regulator with XRE-family HTH domain